MFAFFTCDPAPTAVNKRLKRRLDTEQRFYLAVLAFSLNFNFPVDVGAARDWENFFVVWNASENIGFYFGDVQEILFRIFRYN